MTAELRGGRQGKRLRRPPKQLPTGRPVDDKQQFEQKRTM
jgi:hypothetical protein